ncbi:hypothetical protein SEUCBS139899_002434 [Sporothrix eucalyptigena]
MPRPNRKRARSDDETGGLSHRRSRREDDETGEDDGRDDSGTANGMDVDANGDDVQAQGSQQQRAWKLPAGYDDSNRAFLQALMAHGALTFQQAQQVLAPILNVKKAAEAAARSGQSPSQVPVENMQPDDITFDILRQYISQAKAALAPLDFDIRSATNERSIGSGSGGTANDHRVWVLVSTDSDPKAHLAVLFTPRKLAFIHRLLDAIFDTYNTPHVEALCFTGKQAIKLSRPPRTSEGPSEAGGEASQQQTKPMGLKHSVVYSLLDSLVRQGWLSKSTRGFYALTTRALLELEPFLVETYNTPEPAGAATPGTTWQRIKYCAACRELITSGLRCATPTCTLRVHDHCEEAFWRTQLRHANRGGGGVEQRHRCPKCEAPWGKAEDVNGEVEGKLYFVGERAITSTETYRLKQQKAQRENKDLDMDDVVRSLNPRAATGSRGGRNGEVAEPFRRAAARRRSGVDEGDAEGDDEV